MNVTAYIPHPALQEFVINIATIDATLPEGIGEVVTPYPPTPFQSLIFYCNDPVSMGLVKENKFLKQPDIVLIGPQFSRVNIKVHKKLRSVRVDFYPGGMFRLLGLPMHEIFDIGLDAMDVFGTELKYINEQLKNSGNLHEAKNIVEQFLLSEVKKMRVLLPFDASMKVLLQNHGNISIENAASYACLSLKQFERKCKERLGMNPKSYAKILRFSKAYRLREARPDLTWTEIACLSGYFDQMHLIRDFKTFAGVNPSVIEQQLLTTPLRMQKDLPY